MKYKTICVPAFFDKLPLDIQILVYELNWEHRIMLKRVLCQFMKYLFCENCGKSMLPSILTKISCCSSDCMYEYIESYSYHDSNQSSP
jgi:hypothetical protein